MNIKDNSLQFFSEKESIASWLPDGNTLVILTKDFNPPQVSIYLMNMQTKEANLIYSNLKKLSQKVSWAKRRYQSIAQAN